MQGLGFAIVASFQRLVTKVTDRLKIDPNTLEPRPDYHEMSLDYCKLHSPEFRAKYGDDWYAKFHQGLTEALNDLNWR